jgi:hypothetical protein
MPENGKSAAQPLRSALTTKKTDFIGSGHGGFSAWLTFGDRTYAAVTCIWLSRAASPG